MSGETVVGLKCRLCGKIYPKEAINFCTEDFGPLEVVYDYEAVARTMSRAAIRARAPLDVAVSRAAAAGRRANGWHARSAARRWSVPIGWPRRWASPSFISRTTPSITRRCRSRIASLRWRFRRRSSWGSRRSGAPRPGNLANSVAANAAAAGLEAYVLIPDGLEQGKVLGATIYGAHVIAIEGNYDQVNRLCSQIAFRFGWGFVNVNLRPFYAEGSKSFGFEIAEDLGWRVPDHVVAPMAGGSLIGKIHKAFKELELLGLVDGPVSTKMHGAQATGCNPISATVKTGASKVKPVRNPQTIAKSLAIGDPADGYFASQLIQSTGGWSEDVDDESIIDAMRLLAETEGIWTETAGGVTLAVAQKLIEQGRIDRDESIVVCITGNGLKTQEPLLERMRKPVVIKPLLADFESLVESHSPALAAAGA